MGSWKRARPAAADHTEPMTAETTEPGTAATGKTTLGGRIVPARWRVKWNPPDPTAASTSRACRPRADAEQPEDGGVPLPPRLAQGRRQAREPVDGFGPGAARRQRCGAATQAEDLRHIGEGEGVV